MYNPVRVIYVYVYVCQRGHILMKRKKFNERLTLCIVWAGLVF